jgi:alginate O-acetyltransferase complex protein AlgI
MVFSSEIFLFTFLPLFLLVYYAAPFRFRSGIIVVFSYAFYGWWRVDFLALLIGMTLWVYWFGGQIYRTLDTKAAKVFCIIGVSGCLAVLGVFKYFNFFIDNFAGLMGKTPADLGVTLRIILPIGVSFFVFHAISYMVDISRKEVPPADNLVDFAAFIALFPHLVAGPVLRYKDLSAQLKSREHSFPLFLEGVRWFTFGLAKKVLVADSVAPIADQIFNQSNPTFVESWLGALAYTVQIYFDFSGYSEMAVGLGLMIGIRFIQNFHFPYMSRSITEFWRRWHISLSVWLRDYLYVPLGGNRRGVTRTYINLFLTMLIGGLWHGANWTFVLWGAFHGGVLAVERAVGVGKATRSVWFIPLTFVMVIFAWVMFRAPDIAVALDMYRGMVGANGFAIRPELSWQIANEGLVILIVGLAIIVIEPFASNLTIARNEDIIRERIGTIKALAVCVLAMVAVLRVAEQSFSPFLYFQF